MNNYEKIKQACISANPKLLELSFGCEIKTEKWSFNNPIETITQTYHGEYLEYECSGRSGMIRANEIKEILGHEPQLSDVLMVIGKYWEQDFNVGVNGNKLNMAFIDGSADIDQQATIVSWDLSKPLKDQSEECLTFLAELL